MKDKSGSGIDKGMKVKLIGRNINCQNHFLTGGTDGCLLVVLHFVGIGFHLIGVRFGLVNIGGNLFLRFLNTL